MFSAFADKLAKSVFPLLRNCLRKGQVTDQWAKANKEWWKNYAHVPKITNLRFDCKSGGSCSFYILYDSVYRLNKLSSLTSLYLFILIFKSINKHNIEAKTSVWGKYVCVRIRISMYVCTSVSMYFLSFTLFLILI